MKNLGAKPPIAVGLLACMMAFGAGAANANAQTRLDDAMGNAARNLSAGFETGARIAVVSIEAGTERMAGHLLDGMIGAFVDLGRFAVVSRNEVELALLMGELDFNMSGFVDDDTAQFIGRFFGAQFIVAGALDSLGEAFILRARVVEVETAVIRGMHTETVAPDRVIRYLLGEVDSSRFWSLGVSVGTAFADPWVIGTVWGTLAPLRNSFIRGGVDLGFFSDNALVVGYYSIVPFVHYAFFLPFDELPIPFTMGGWHIGAGVGFVIEEHRFAHFAVQRRDFIADFVTGFNVGNMLDISYTLRTDFSAFMQKISVGFTHRFR